MKRLFSTPARTPATTPAAPAPLQQAQTALVQGTTKVLEALSIADDDQMHAPLLAALDSGAMAMADIFRLADAPKPVDLRECVRQAVKDVTTHRLHLLASTRGGPELENALAPLPNRHSNGLVLLSAIRDVIHAELEQRIAPEVDRLLAESLDSLSQMPGGTQIPDLRFARDRVAALSRPLVLREAWRPRPRPECVVFERLTKVPEAQCEMLLAHASPDDLMWLRNAGVEVLQSGPADAVAVGDALAWVTTELRARPTFLKARFDEQVATFLTTLDRRRAAGLGADIASVERQLGQMAAILTQLRELSPTPGTLDPVLSPASLPRLQARLGSLFAPAAANPAAIDPGTLLPSHTLALSHALNAMGGRALTQQLLGPAQRQCLEAQRANHGRQLAAVLRHLDPQSHPRALLQALASFEQAATALEAATVAFHPTEEGAAAAGRNARTAAMTQFLEEFSREHGAALPGILGTPQGQALICALHAGASLAMDVHETAMSTRFTNMASLLEAIAPRGGQMAAAHPAQQARFAAENLAPEARDILLETFDLLLPAHGRPGLNGTRLPPSQTRRMAAIFEKRASENESRLTAAGNSSVGLQFANDAGRLMPYWISGDPLIDTRTWPDGPEAKALIPLRIEQGYQKLITLCGAEQQAQQLTVYAHQGAMASFLTTGYSPDSPLHLPDGTPGQISPKGKGATEKTEIRFSVSAGGRPRFDVDYHLTGATQFKLAGQFVFIALTPESYLHAHFAGELQDDGTMALIEPPYYSFLALPAPEPATDTQPQS